MVSENRLLRIFAKVAMAFAPLMKFPAAIKSGDSSYLGSVPMSIANFLTNVVWFIMGWFYLNNFQVLLFSALVRAFCTTGGVVVDRYCIQWVKWSDHAIRRSSEVPHSKKLLHSKQTTDLGLECGRFRGTHCESRDDCDIGLACAATGSREENPRS